MTAGRRPDIARWYPVGIAVAWFIAVYAFTAVSPFAIPRAGLVVAGVAFGLTAGASMLTRDRDRGAFVSAAILLGLADQGLLNVLLFGGAAIAIVALDSRLVRLGRRSIPWKRVTSIGAVFAVIALLAAGTTLVTTGVAAHAVAEVVDRSGSDRTAAAAPGSPDIWFLLVDALSRSDKLLDDFDLDDQAFRSALESRGVGVSTSSRSNYLQTQMSLVSMLQMRHLDAFPMLADVPDFDPRHIMAVRDLLATNPTFDLLRHSGYRITTISSGWEEVTLRGADDYLDSGQLNEFELYLLKFGAGESIVDLIAPRFFEEQHAQRIDQTFETLRSLAPTESVPRFVFAHIPAPHAPVIMDAEGRVLDGPDLAHFYDEQADVDRLGRRAFADRYAGSVSYLQRRILESIDAIQGATATPPVIVIASDHGSGLDWNLKDPDGSDLDHRTANFFAAATPGHPGLFDPDHHLINTMPRLSNAYLGADIDDLPAVSYSWQGVSTFDIVPIPPDRLHDDP